MSSAHHDRDADRPPLIELPAALARIADLERELSLLQHAEADSRHRQQQLSQHNLVLVNLSRSAAIDQGDLKAAFEEITLAAAHTLNVARASIWLFADDRSAIRCSDLYQRLEDRHGNGLELRAADFPSYFAAIEGNRTLSADDAQKDPRTAEFTPTYLGPLGITSMLDAPVRLGGKLIGVICHEHIGPRRNWSLEDQAFAGSMADFVALTVKSHERAEALKATRASERQLRQIIDLVPHMIFVKDAQGRIIICNRAAADAYGTNVDRLIGRIQWDVHPRLDEAAAMLSDDLRVIETCQSSVLPDERFTDVAGKVHLLQTTKIPLMLSNSQEPAVLGVSIDITQRKADEQAKELMIQELDHRVKNNLAVVQSIATQTAKGAHSIDSFILGFEGRLRALAIAHELLAQTRWEGADLRRLIDRLMEPYARSDGEPRVTCVGESLRLPPHIAPGLCMVLHELATNAAKHGALSRPSGLITLEWQREMRFEGEARASWLRLEWHERGGPALDAAAAPPRAGFGTTLIEQTISYQLRGKSRLQYSGKGLTALIELPFERVNGRVRRDATTPPPFFETGATNGAGTRSHAASSGKRVLVVEDDALVAQSIATHLQSLGCEVVGPAATSDDACTLVKSRPLDAAILDINLSEGTSAPVARALAGRRTPFVFVTGYSSLKTLPDDLRGQRVLRTPVDRETLGRAIQAMVQP